MPSIITHHLFANEVLELLPIKLKKTIEPSKNIFDIFAQSFDNLFYYNLLNLKKGKAIRNFGNFAQNHFVNSYFMNIVTAIKENHLENNHDCLAYLYGSLTHYILDRTCHPFIIYQAGFIDEKKPNFQYRGNHEKIETTIDAIMLQEKRNRKIHKSQLAQELLPKSKFSAELKKIMNEVFFQTFKKENMGSIYEKSAHQGHNILKLFVTDRTGIKKQFYKFFDRIFSHNLLMYQYLDFHIKNPNYEYLNRNHEIWTYPADPCKQSNESFEDLYQKAIQETIKIFKATNNVLNNKMTMEDYSKLIGNDSYVTGLDSNIPRTMTNFKN